MNKKQKTAADLFLKTKDKKRASMLAGYKSEKVFENEDVIQYINEKRNDCGFASEDEILNYLSEVLRSDEAINYKIKAAELLGKRYGTFSEKNDNADQVIIIRDDIFDENERRKNE